MEMIDVLKKLEEIAQTRPELVADAVDNVSRTNPAEVQDNAVQTERVGGMSDIHIGAEEVVGEYADEDGNLKMAKADVLRAMSAEKAKAAFPRSYEIETAMAMVNDKFDDNGEAKADMDMSSEQPAQEPEATEGNAFADAVQKAKAAGMKKGDKFKVGDEEHTLRDSDFEGESTRDMTTEDKKQVNEAIQISTDTPQEASMMMQLLKLAGVQPVDQAMISQGEPEHGSDMDPGEMNKQMDVPGDDAMGSMQMAKMRDMMTAPEEEKAEETFANSMGDEKEEPKYQDTDTLVNFHSGGLNSQKQQVRKEYPGDNPLAVKEDTISEEDVANSLRAQYEGFKAQYQEAAKPDFLDMDKDGDKKESAVREDEETHPLWGDWGTTPQEWSDTHVANNDDMVMAIAKGQIPPKPVTLSSYFDEQNDLWPEGVEGGKYNDEQIIDIISDTVGYDCRALGYDYLVKIRDGEVKGMYKPTPEQIKTAQEIIKNPEFAKAKARNSRPMESTSEDAVREDSAKPDFLDMDKDGNKKEPMKKAIKDKEAK